MRKYIRTIAKPGIRMFELCETLEDRVRELIEVPPVGPSKHIELACSCLSDAQGFHLSLLAVYLRSIMFRRCSSSLMLSPSDAASLNRT